MARLGRRQSVRLLEVAHASGITHFDTARAYGYGEAESALGEFLSRRREGVTLTTKLGMLPPRRSRALQAAKGLARVAVSLSPASRRFLRSRAESMVRAGRFDPHEARGSLETSLRELGTDVVDILLLHECRPEDLRTEGLLEFLEAAVREGKVRYFGVGTDAESTRTILTECPEFARVVQVAHNPIDRTIEELPGVAGRAVITHSPVREALAPLTELMRDQERRDRWSRELRLDSASPGVLGRLLLAYALASNAEGIVLFSSANEARIRSNAALADQQEFSSEQIDHFALLAREAIAGEALRTT